MGTLTEELADFLGLKNWSIRGDELWARCPSHDDTNPSWSLNLETGWHFCFACQYKGYYLSLLNDLGVQIGRGVLLWGSVRGMPRTLTNGSRWPLTREEVDPYLLRVSDVALKRLPDERLLREYLVGSDVTNGLPVFVATNRKGDYLGVWAKSETGVPKYYLMGPPDAKERGALFGAHLPPTEETVVCEGFYQAMAVNSTTGLKAVATMGTAVTANQLRALVDMSPLLVMFDGDDPGRRARDSLVERVVNARGWGRVAGGYAGDPDDLPRERLVEVVLGGRAMFDHLVVRMRK